MKKGVIIGLVSSLIVTISMWLPAVSVENETASWMNAAEVKPDLGPFIWGVVIYIIHESNS